MSSSRGASRIRASDIALGLRDLLIFLGSFIHVPEHRRQEPFRTDGYTWPMLIEASSLPLDPATVLTFVMEVFDKACKRNIFTSVKDHVPTWRTCPPVGSYRRCNHLGPCSLHMVSIGPRSITVMECLPSFRVPPTDCCQANTDLQNLRRAMMVVMEEPLVALLLQGRMRCRGNRLRSYNRFITTESELMTLHHRCRCRPSTHEMAITPVSDPLSPGSASPQVGEAGLDHPINDNNAPDSDQPAAAPGDDDDDDNGPQQQQQQRDLFGPGPDPDVIAAVGRPLASLLCLFRRVGGRSRREGSWVPSPEGSSPSTSHRPSRIPLQIARATTSPAVPSHPPTSGVDDHHHSSRLEPDYVPTAEELRTTALGRFRPVRVVMQTGVQPSEIIMGGGIMVGGTTMADVAEMGRRRRRTGERGGQEAVHVEDADDGGASLAALSLVAVHGSESSHGRSRTRSS